MNEEILKMDLKLISSIPNWKVEDQLAKLMKR